MSIAKDNLRLKNIYETNIFEKVAKAEKEGHTSG